MAHPYAEVEKAIIGLRESFVEAERRNTWAWIADEFYAPDCVYTCPYGGTIAVVANGREEIRRTHYGRDMDVGSGWAGWSFPILNYAINGDFVITHLVNRGPGRHLFRAARRLLHHLCRRREIQLAIRPVRFCPPDAAVRRVGGCRPAECR